MEGRIVVAEVIGGLGAPANGAASVVMALAAWLDRERFAATVFAYAGSRKQADRPAAGISVHFAEESRGHLPGRFALTGPLLAAKPDVIHIHGVTLGHALVSAILVKAIRRNTRIVVTYHGPAWRTQAPHRLFEKPMFQWVDLFTAVSASAAEHVSRNVPAHKLAVIRNGIDFRRFDVAVDKASLLRDLGLEQGKRVVGFVGRMHNQKGHILLLEAAQKILQARDDVQFLLVGDGPMRSQLQQLACEKHLDRGVVFCGERDDVPAVLQVIDVFAFPAIYEAMPIAALEAMASRRPIVASAIGGLLEIIEDGKNGLLTPAGDASALEAGIVTLLTDEKLAAGLGTAGRRTVEERFSIEQMTHEYEEQFEACLNKSH